MNVKKNLVPPSLFLYPASGTWTSDWAVQTVGDISHLYSLHDIQGLIKTDICNKLGIIRI